MINKQWGVFFFVSLILIFLLSTYWIYSWKETETKLRMQKELELSDKITELTQTQAKLSDLTQQKDDLETQLKSLKSKIADLGDALEVASKDYNATIKSQNEKLEALNQKNEALEKDLQSKEEMVSNLSKESRRLKADKSDLLDQIKHLNKHIDMLDERVEKSEKAERSAAASRAENSESSNNADLTWISKINTIDLGKIVVQKSSGHAAQVQHVDEEFGFIVINAGTEDGLEYNTPVNILRDNKLIGKAVIQKANPNVSAAIIIPQFTKEKVKEGDVISIF